MKKFPYLFLALLLSLSLHAAEKPRRVLCIALDGVSTYGLTTARTPHIDALLGESAYTLSARNVIPSVTLPNWTSILCGSAPERHGVVDNAWTTTSYKLKAVESDADGYYPSVFKALKDGNPAIRTAYYWNWKALINSLNPEYMDEKNYLENDGYVENFNKAFDFMAAHRDEPTFVFLYDVHTDHAGHGYGWKSPNFIASIEQADAQVGILLDKMKAAGMYEETYILFLVDHGGVGYGHGGYSSDEMDIPWGIKGPDIKPGLFKWQQFTVNTASIICRLFGVEQPAVWSGTADLPLFAAANPTILPSPETEEAIWYTVKNRTFGGYLATDAEGRLCVSADATADAAQWKLTIAENGTYRLVNKSQAGKALGEADGMPAMVEAADAAAWHVKARPGEKGVYCISRTENALAQTLAATDDGKCGYWTPSAFDFDGLEWVFDSDDRRAQINEVRAELLKRVAAMKEMQADMAASLNDAWVGSYTAAGIDSLARALADARQVADDAEANIDRLDAAAAALEQALAFARKAENLVEVKDGDVYRIRNADPRFATPVYMYATPDGKVRWGVVDETKSAACYDWRVTVVEGKGMRFFNVGAQKYLGSSAWDASRPANILVGTTPYIYEVTNTLSTLPYEWNLRSDNSLSVANPQKSYLACTDDNSSNLKDGRVLPWDPTDANGLHDGYWNIVWQSSGDELQSAIAALQSEINAAEAKKALMEQYSDPDVVGAFRPESVKEAEAAVAAAKQAAANPAATAEMLREAAETLKKALAAATADQRLVAFEEGATYEIVNADPRFETPVFMYANDESKVRWGVKNADRQEDCYRWKLVKFADGKLQWLNVSAQKYLGSSAWDASRPANILVGDTPYDYEATATYGDIPCEWNLRSTDSYEAKNPQKSYLACSGDNASNLSDGTVRPWDPTDVAASDHDAFWRFVKVAAATSLPVVTKGDWTAYVSNKTIRVKGADRYDICDMQGKAVRAGTPLPNGMYVVTVGKESRKVMVEK